MPEAEAARFEQRFPQAFRIGSVLPRAGKPIQIL
jgi:hypothetical protein